MRNTKWLVAIWVALMTTSTVLRAGVSVNVIPVGTNPVDENGFQATGFTAYLIRIVTDDGSVISAVDAGDNTGPTGLSNGLFGTFLQNWDVFHNTRSPTPIESDTFSPQGFYSIDSHLLPVAGVTYAPAEAPFSVNPFEDNTLVNPPGSPPDSASAGADFGSGTRIQATFGILGDDQSTTLNLAYVLLPTNQVGSYSMDISTSSTSDAFVSGVIPEPSMLLPALGFGALVLRRRASAR